MSWGTWEEDRRYPSKDGTHMIVVSKRVDGDGNTYRKNERKRLTPGEREHYAARVRSPN